MSKLKKLLVGALALCMTISVAACGGGSSDGESKNNSTADSGTSTSGGSGKKTDYVRRISFVYRKLAEDILKPVCK